MPTYDYRCDDCGHAFEVFQGMLEKKLTTCPSCGGAVRRLIGAGAGVVFKGSGFYETDYRSADYRKKAKADSSTGESPNEKKATSGAAPAKTKTATEKRETGKKANAS